MCVCLNVCLNPKHITLDFIVMVSFTVNISKDNKCVVVKLYLPDFYSEISRNLSCNFPSWICACVQYMKCNKIMSFCSGQLWQSFLSVCDWQADKMHPPSRDLLRLLFHCMNLKWIGTLKISSHVGPMVQQLITGRLTSLQVHNYGWFILSSRMKT